MLNRVAMLVRPQKPYIDWCLNLDDSGIAPRPDDEVTVYLVPEPVKDDWRAELIREVYEEVFESELHAWHTEPSAWPSPRTLPMFKKWFKIEFHSIVVDICAEPLFDDEDDHLVNHRN